MPIRTSPGDEVNYQVLFDESTGKSEIILTDFEEVKKFRNMEGIRSITKIRNRKLLFIDIETAREFPSLKDGGDKLKNAWSYKQRNYEEKTGKKLTAAKLASLYKSDAALYAEFAKVVVITVGFYNKKTEEVQLKSFYGRDEKAILEEFSSFMIENSYAKESTIVGHSIKGFDIPFLCRRMAVHQVEIPGFLDMSGLKPWDIDRILDISMEWRFSSWYVGSLSDMCYCLGIDTPKDELKGSEVSDVFHKEIKDGEGDPVEEIVTYCEKDVVATAKLFYKMAYRPI